MLYHEGSDGPEVTSSGVSSMAGTRPGLQELRKQKPAGHVRSGIRTEELEALIAKVKVKNAHLPTDYPPGSVEKMAVMRARNELAMDSLHVPGDRRGHGKQVA